MEENQALSTLITEEHHKINHLFVEKVIALLQQGEFKVTQYAIEDRRYGGQKEQANLELPDGSSMTLFWYGSK